ncbi:MAG: CoA-binding protein [Anaerolineales bacterium]
MAKLKDLVEEFLSQDEIAVVGVSDQRETGCNQAFRNFRDSGYTVYPVNPRIDRFEGVECYPDLPSIPRRPNAVFILTNPSVTDYVVRQCVDLGIKHIWMHCMMGTKPGLAGSMTSVSPEAVELCRQNGINIIPGSCPNQFLNPDFPHRLMRGLWGALGFNRVVEPSPPSAA